PPAARRLRDPLRPRRRGPRRTGAHRAGAAGAGTGLRRLGRQRAAPRDPGRRRRPRLGAHPRGGDALGRAAGEGGARARPPGPEGEMHWEKLRVTAPDGSGHPDGWFVVGYFTAADLAELGATTRTVGLVGAVGLLFTGTAAWWVSGRILAPVRLVRQAAAEISEEDLTRRIDVPGNDDVAALAEQFNGMLDRLQDAFDVQRRFIDDAGHELRTPITIVRGHLELMGDDPEERREVVRLVTDELDRMARIVEDLLLLAKAERPDFLHYERVSVEELTIDIDAKVRALGEREWRLEEIGEGPIRADP